LHSLDDAAMKIYNERNAMRRRKSGEVLGNATAKA
jgi:hypothetical protein